MYYHILKRKEDKTIITIREIRLNILKLSMKEMADLLGISRNGYWMKESGKRKFKSNELLMICKLANIDPLTVLL